MEWEAKGGTLTARSGVGTHILYRTVGRVGARFALATHKSVCRLSCRPGIRSMGGCVHRTCGLACGLLVDGLGAIGWSCAGSGYFFPGDCRLCGVDSRLGDRHCVRHGVHISAASGFRSMGGASDTLFSVARAYRTLCSFPLTGDFYTGFFSPASRPAVK